MLYYIGFTDLGEVNTNQKQWGEKKIGRKVSLS